MYPGSPVPSGRPSTPYSDGTCHDVDPQVVPDAALALDDMLVPCSDPEAEAADVERLKESWSKEMYCRSDRIGRGVAAITVDSSEDDSSRLLGQWEAVAYSDSVFVAHSD